MNGSIDGMHHLAPVPSEEEISLTSSVSKKKWTYDSRESVEPESNCAYD